MINHIRTILLGCPGNTPVLPWVIGEEYVPPAYQPAMLTGPLQQVRDALFGKNPDRSYLNYQLARYMTILHATELAEFVYAADPRITYPSATSLALFNPSLFQPAQQTPSGEPPLILQGLPAAPDTQGQSYQEFSLQTNAGILSVLQTYPAPAVTIQTPYVLESGLGPLIALGTSGYSVRVPAATDGTVWGIRCNLRPQLDPGQTFQKVYDLGAATQLALFTGDNVEPMMTFHNLFLYHSELPYRLGAVLLALATQLEAA
jgi:hypothetical protein